MPSLSHGVCNSNDFSSGFESSHFIAEGWNVQICFFSCILKPTKKAVSAISVSFNLAYYANFYAVLLGE